MKILRVSHRYFLVETQRDYENIALKLLNERRLIDAGDPPKLKEFIVKITDEQDGNLAVSMIPRLWDAEVILPETV